MMTDKDILNEFGASLMKLVRDRSIDRFERIRTGSLKGPQAIELHNLLSRFNEKQKSEIGDLVVEIIDNVIFNFLFMFEEDDNKRIFSSGVDLNEISDGLSGELFSDDGWIKKFSKK